MIKFSQKAIFKVLLAGIFVINWIQLIIYLYINISSLVFYIYCILSLVLLSIVNLW